MADPVEALKPVLSKQDLDAAIRAVPRVQVSEELVDYLLDLIEATRRHPQLALGASTRTSLGLRKLSH